MQIELVILSLKWIIFVNCSRALAILFHMHLILKLSSDFYIHFVHYISHVHGLPIEFPCEAMVTYIFCLFDRGPPRFGDDRPRFGDRDGYRGAPRGAPGDFGGEKGGAPAEFQPSFRVSSGKLVSSI